MKYPFCWTKPSWYLMDYDADREKQNVYENWTNQNDEIMTLEASLFEDSTEWLRSTEAENFFIKFICLEEIKSTKPQNCNLNNFCICWVIKCEKYRNHQSWSTLRNFIMYWKIPDRNIAWIPFPTMNVFTEFSKLFCKSWINYIPGFCYPLNPCNFTT